MKEFNATPPRGLLVAFEGIDGSGKATQVTLARDYLHSRGLTLSTFSFPDYDGPLGLSIREALTDSCFDPYALQLLLSAERVRHRPLLLQAISELNLVLLDRYKWSAHAYATARGLPKEWSQNLETVLPEPQLTILLDLPPAISIIRTGRSDYLESDAGMLALCRAEYLRLAQTLPNWIILDATLPAHDTHSKIITAIANQLPANLKDLLQATPQ